MDDNKVEMSIRRCAPERSFRSFFFGSGFGYMCYYFLRNDWAWALLNEQEQNFVRQQNEYWNNNAPGYDYPEQYQGQRGQSFSSQLPRDISWEGMQLKKYLESMRPRRVLEIGPGSGFYTRLIIESESVEKYIAVDINKKFLEFISRAITEHKYPTSLQTVYLSADELEGEDIQVDAIVILSALHHIPDRDVFVKRISKHLCPGGSLFIYEPTHSLTRVLELLWSFMLNRWFLNSVVQKRNNFMTHHFCTISETRKIAQFAKLNFVSWNVKSLMPNKARQLAALFSRKMVVILSK